MLLKNKKSGNYLEGGPKAMRLASEGLGNRSWIEWEKTSINGSTAFRNKQTGGYLDGGTNHMRSSDLGTENPDWITWNVIDAGNGYFKIQNVANGKYLCGDGEHHMSTSDDDSIQWKMDLDEAQVSVNSNNANRFKYYFNTKNPPGCYTGG